MPQREEGKPFKDIQLPSPYLASPCGNSLSATYAEAPFVDVPTAAEQVARNALSPKADGRPQRSAELERVQSLIIMYSRMDWIFTVLYQR